MQANNSTGGFMLQTMLYLVNHSPNSTLMNTIYGFPGEQSADASDIACYGVYGCFPITDPWTVETRPVSLYPFSPKKLNVKFPVFHKNQMKIPKFIDLDDPDSVHDVGINPRGNIYFIAHGYLESGERPWIQNITKYLIESDTTGQDTVVIVDWRLGSSPPYSQAVANIRLVGAITAHIIHLISEELRLPNLDKVHFIGHSLGAHLAGYAGYTLQVDFSRTLGRITGLDPAEPLFKETDPLVRLDRSDAKFVDVVHSDIMPFIKGGLGMKDAIGHVDFYPNNGQQPGCDGNVEDFMDDEHSVFRGFQKLVGCNHVRSIMLFTESIKSSCPFLAISCENYEDFTSGKCFKCGENDQHCIKFGMHSYQSYKNLYYDGYYRDSKPLTYFFMTGPVSPYCKTHYKITVKVSNSDESRIHGGEVGVLWFQMRGNNTWSEKFPATLNPVPYEPDNIYTSVAVGDDIGPVHNATVFYHYKASLINILTWRLYTPRVYIEYVIIESMEYNTRTRLCPSHQLPVEATDSVFFREQSCNHLSKHY